MDLESQPAFSSLTTNVHPAASCLGSGCPVSAKMRSAWASMNGDGSLVAELVIVQATRR